MTVSFVTDEPATLRCRIDGADPVACERTARYTGLAAGIHTFEVVATDEAGNVGRPVSRRFAVAVPAPVSQPPVTPVTAVKPVTPPVQVIDQRTQRPRVSITGYPRRLKLATLRRSGMRVQVRAGAGTAVVRVRIRTATARPKVIATVLRKVKAGDLRLSLTPKDLRKLSLGRYAIEVAAGSSQSSLGAGQAVSFRVVR